MVAKYFIFLPFLFILNISHAQETTPESILPNISDTYIEKLVASAKTHYPKANTFIDRTEIARLNIQKAKFDWFNILTFNYLYAPTGSTVVTGAGASFLNGYSFGVGTNIGNILQKPALVKIAKQEYDIAQLNQEEYFLNLTAIVKQRYYAYLQQLSLLNWATKNMEAADRVVKESKYKFEKGEETFDSYNSSNTSYSSTVIAKIAAETAYLTAKSSLEEIIGVKIEEIK